MVDGFNVEEESVGEIDVGDADDGGTEEECNVGTVVVGAAEEGENVGIVEGRIVVTPVGDAEDG